MKSRIKERARELGFDLCGIGSAAPPSTAGAFLRWLEAGRHGEMTYLARRTEQRSDPQQLLPGAKSVISVAVSYATPEQAAASPSQPGRITGLCARYARYGDYHEALGGKLEELAGFLRELVQPAPQARCCVDTGPVLERDLAQRAGLGFIGKHTNLISRSLGNWLFLGEIMTTLELEPDVPERNRCGRCRRCLDACPTQAITEPFQLDARRCLSYLTIELKGPIPIQFRPALGNRIFGCDDCLEVCPWNRFARDGRLMKAHLRPDLSAPDLLELLELDDASFRRRFAGTPVLRAKRRGLLRNVCVALGNVGDLAAVPALERASRDPEPLIAEHAVWALSEIRSRSAEVTAQS